MTTDDDRLVERFNQIISSYPHKKAVRLLCEIMETTILTLANNGDYRPIKAFRTITEWVRSDSTDTNPLKLAFRAAYLAGRYASDRAERDADTHRKDQTTSPAAYAVAKLADYAHTPNQNTEKALKYAILDIHNVVDKLRNTTKNPKRYNVVLTKEVLTRQELDELITMLTDVGQKGCNKENIGTFYRVAGTGVA